MAKVSSDKWESLLPGNNPFGDFRLADFSRESVGKSGKKSDVSAAPSANSTAKDSFEMVDAKQVLYIRSLLR